ncbi:hypothetical protein [Amycolatopsis sp. NPDC051903]|uniref:hypothetical protein n=1 Tax=Amycolatopsis sp. NPDC051903 TaxID=3363936 RepID=UPI00379DD39A
MLIERGLRESEEDTADASARWCELPAATGEVDDPGNPAHWPGMIRSLGHDAAESFVDLRRPAWKR